MFGRDLFSFIEFKSVQEPRLLFFDKAVNTTTALDIISITILASHLRRANCSLTDCMTKYSSFFISFISLVCLGMHMLLQLLLMTHNIARIAVT